MVEQPQRVESRQLGDAALLPVEPPEVDALVLERVVQLLEVGLDERRVGEVEADRHLGGGVDAEPLGHRLVGRLVGVDALGRVHVQRDREAALVQVGEELLGVGEQVGVPAVAGPAAAVLRVDVDQVPVHVDDRHRQRDALAAEAVDQVDVLLGGVGVVAAPPVAERVARQQRGRAGQLVERLQCPLVVAAVGEDVEVLVARGARRHPAVVVEQHARRVVDQGDAVERQHAVLQRHRAVDVVERAGGAAEVGHVEPVAPHRVVRVVAALGLHRQPVRRERPLVVDQVQALGVDLEPVAGLGHLEVGRRERAVDDHLRGTVLEGAGLAVLQPHQPVVEHGDPVVLALQHVPRIGDRMRLETEVVFHRASVATTRIATLKPREGVVFA